MNADGHRIKHLIQELIAPVTFFFVSFELLAFTKALMLRQYGIELTDFLSAAIGALVAAKVILLSDLLPFVNRFPNRPLIYNILWRTLIYFAAAGLVRYLEELIHFYLHHHEIIGVDRHLLEEVVWPHFWAIQIWLTVLLMIYTTLDELVRVLGRDRMRELFLGIKPAAKQP